MVSLGIQMFQINLHHSKSASVILARSMAVMHTSIALIQEPWIVNGAVKGLSGCGCLYKAHSENRVRSCILVKELNAIFLPQLSSEDLTVIKVRVKLAEEEDMEVLIGSVYMPYDSTDPPPHKKVKNLVAYAEARGLELLLGCDANSHHVGWGSTDTNLREESLHDYLMGTGLTILNRGNKPTFLDSRRQEVIDITVCKKRVASLVNDWRVSDEPSGSDHRQIRLTLQQIQQISWVRNPQKTNWEGFRADLKVQLAMVTTSFRTKNNLENVADFLKNAITNAFELNCLPKLRNPLNKIHCIESAPEASRLHRILSLDHRPHLDCLKLPTENVTEEATDTLKHLMEVHFPGFDHNIQPCRPNPREYKPRDWRLAAEVVFPKGVKWGVKTFSPYKSLGPDGIYPVLLQEGLAVLIGPLTKIFRASIALRHVPQAWSGTRVVFIPKPGRNGHITAKNFRPISITSFVLKTLERLVDKYLKTGPLLVHPLSPAHYAYREGRSTDTALHHLVGGVEVQLEAKGYALGVFLDIEGAFDSTSYDVIREAMTGHHILAALADWTQSMLTGRTLIANHGDSSVHGFPAKGCPQGGVLSLLL
ncbi:uncharacterized protein LOC109862474 [Pseudomyrmex gracilis]|uniref:uncharacterized protein LOC109862474 n=1 Tax=Pseudomyrmex gracilis TaxID=219809 RepID=UPI000994D6D0|nr:uncharacterized protein LOC109862474 [Pseudomyrmex gracilis]